MHIHIEQADRYAKFWLNPIQLAESDGFRSGEISELRKLVQENKNCLRRSGMSTLAVKVEPKIIDLSFSSDSLRVVLADGREVLAPLEWFPRLRDATDMQKKNWRIIGRGIGVHWEDIDEDISVNSLLTTS